jgi:Major intrinsic protein
MQGFHKLTLEQVTLGLCLVGAVPFSRGGFVFIAQMLGSMASAGVVAALFPGPLAVTTSLGGGTNLAQGLFIEMFLTAQLVFTILMLAAEKHKSTFLAPIGIGLSLFIAELGGLLTCFPPECQTILNFNVQVSTIQEDLLTLLAALALVWRAVVSPASIGFIGWARVSARSSQQAFSGSSKLASTKQPTLVRILTTLKPKSSTPTKTPEGPLLVKVTLLSEFFP